MSNVKILTFLEHEGDILSRVIGIRTREPECHAAFLVAPATNEIVEAYVPTVRRRQLRNSELPGILVYDIPGMTIEQEKALLDYLAAAVKAHEPYSIAQLFEFYSIPRLLLGDKEQPPSVAAPTFCSELVMRGQTFGAKYPILNAEPQKIAPGYLKYSTLISLDKPLTPLA